MKTLVQIGAGNIGRSFVGQLFARAGYQVVFIDIDQELVRLLNERRCYTVEIRDRVCETIVIENVRAVDGNDLEAAAREIAAADVAATAVGAHALPAVYPSIALGITNRHRRGEGPLDIIICENLRNAAQAFRLGLQQHLPADYPLDDMVGLVETSIAKMVPLTTDQQRLEDPLRVYAEAYNTLICDATAFRCGIPDVPGLEPKRNMAPYVDRKLLVHNLGHAATAYFGHLLIPGVQYVWQVVEDDRVLGAARAAMWESGRSLIAEYPGEFDRRNMGQAIEDLLARFGNRALGDTIFRVGRDLPRKLARDDRLIGALILDDKHKVSAPMTTYAAAAAMLFRGTDEHGALSAADQRFSRDLTVNGPEYMLKTVSGLDFVRGQDRRIGSSVLSAYRSIVRARERAEPWLPAVA